MLARLVQMAKGSFKGSMTENSEKPGTDSLSNQKIGGRTVEEVKEVPSIGKNQDKPLSSSIHLK